MLSDLVYADSSRHDLIKRLCDNPRLVDKRIRNQSVRQGSSELIRNVAMVQQTRNNNRVKHTEHSKTGLHEVQIT